MTSLRRLARAGLVVAGAAGLAGFATPASAQLAPEPPASPTPGQAEYAAATPITTSALATALLRSADEHLGTRYVMGGTAPATGFDCSGFTSYVYARIGISLPRTSRQQARLGRAVRRRRGVPLEAILQPGDLLFFASHGRRIDHVAIYAGDGRVVHATAWGRTVRYETLGSTRGAWLRRHHVGTRRILGVLAPTDWTAPALGDALLGEATPTIAAVPAGAHRPAR